MPSRPSASSPDATASVAGRIRRLALVASVGAAAAALALTIAVSVRPSFALEMNADLPRNVSGLYPPEHADATSFAWTAAQVKVALPGADRRMPWECSLRFRGGRSTLDLQPTVDMAVDGITRGRQAATNDYEVLAITAPPSVRQGLTLIITSSNTVVPGPSDRRELGVQVDRLECRPQGRGLVWPPAVAIADAAVSAGVLGAALGAIGSATVPAAAASVLVATMQSRPLAIAPAPYTSYRSTGLWLAIWIAASLAVATTAIERIHGRRLEPAARFVIAFSGVALYLKLLGLLHPLKPLVDAVFQAHRLEWVLGGRYFFTQQMPGGVQFPYAIGLYLFAAPWSVFTRDHVTLLRIVVCATDAVAGALLYPMIVRTSGNRTAGAVAVALFSLVPLSYTVIGNANLTNAFGQSIALITVAAVVVWAADRRRLLQCLGWTALATLAFLSHVSTVATLLVTLVTLAAAYWWRRDDGLRDAARVLLLATIVAALASTALYYGHFTDVYKNAIKVRGDNAAAVAAPQAVRPQSTPTPTPLAGRAASAMTLIAESIGWPLLLLAAIGLWATWQVPARDRLDLALVAWGITFAVFIAVALARVEVEFERYSVEFVGRVAYATYPAAVILAARGVTWLWRRGLLLRLTASVLLVFAVLKGLNAWIAWR